MAINLTYRKMLCPAKVNLILRVGPRRKDGFHDLETLMVPLKWGDFLDVQIRGADELKIELTSPHVTERPEQNLVFRAARAFAEEFRVAFHLRAHLKKVVPTGGGLGGGSSDAAQILLVLAQQFFGAHPGAKTMDRLAGLAGRLGSDVPFFLFRSSAWCTGRGDICQPVQLRPLALVLVLSSEGVPTPWAYRKLDETHGRVSELIGHPPQWINDTFSVPRLENDFEEVVLHLKPQLRESQLALAQEGALATSMTGSGATFFGIFDSLFSAKRAQLALTKRGFWAITTESL